MVIAAKRSFFKINAMLGLLSYQQKKMEIKNRKELNYIFLCSLRVIIGLVLVSAMPPKFLKTSPMK